MDVKTFIIVCLFASACSTALLCLYAARKLRTPGAKAYLGVMLGVTLYSAGYALELSHTDLAGIKQALRIEYLGLPFIPACWLFLALRYTGYSKRIPTWFLALVFTVPVLTALLHYTNDYHHLFYRSLSVSRESPFPLAAITKGPFYYVFVAYANTCMLIGSVLFFRMMLRMKGAFSKQAGILFIASVFPLVGNFIYQQGLTPYGIDIVPFCLTVTGPLGAIALFRFRMFDLVPIARDTLFDVIADPVVVLDNFNRLADFNQAAANVLPALKTLGIGNHIQEVLNDHPELINQIMDHEQSNREIMLQDKNGVQVFDASLMPINQQKNASMGNLLILHDITKQKILFDRLEKQATIDELTGICNRRYLMELSRREIKRANRSEAPVSLILMDLDLFKEVNDSLGHQVGDMVLKSVAATILKQLRSCDIFGRYGGEEFGIVLPETSLDIGEQVAERLRRSLEGHLIQCDGPKVRVTASFGVSSSENNGSSQNVAMLYKLADQALYLAKKNGRNRVEALTGPRDGKQG